MIETHEQADEWHLYAVVQPPKPTRPRGLVQSGAYQTSVTLPLFVDIPILWIRMVSALATWMATTWLKSMYTMWVPAVELAPLVMVEGIRCMILRRPIGCSSWEYVTNSPDLLLHQEEQS